MLELGPDCRPQRPGEVQRLHSPNAFHQEHLLLALLLLYLIGGAGSDDAVVRKPKVVCPGEVKNLAALGGAIHGLHYAVLGHLPMGRHPGQQRSVFPIQAS